MILKKIKKLAKKAINKYESLNQEKDQEKKAKLPSSNKDFQETKIYLSLPDIAKAVIITIGLILLGYFIVELRHILILFLVSYLFAAAISPAVDYFHKKRLSRGLTVSLIMIFFLLIITAFIGNLIPILATEITELGIQFQSLMNKTQTGEIELPNYLGFLQPLLENTAQSVNSQTSTNIQNTLLSYGDNLGQIANNAIALLASISNGLANFIIVLFLTFFITVDQNKVDNFIINLFPVKYKKYLEIKFANIKRKVADWLRGQLLLMLAIGILTYIGLITLGIEYAFTLSLFAALTELIPVIGPIIAWLAAIPIAANAGGSTILWVSGVYFLIQRLENNLLVPFIMEKTTGLHPIIVIFSLLAGFKFLGILGVVISVPIMTIIAIFLNDYLPKNNS